MDYAYTEILSPWVIKHLLIFVKTIGPGPLTCNILGSLINAISGQPKHATQIAHLPRVPDN